MLAYSAGWLSGALVLSLEGRRLGVRRHAAQALVGFGLLTLVAMLLLAAAALSLFVSITAFRVLLWLSQAVVLTGVVCWGLALVQTARGVDWRWPLIAPYAERLARLMTDDRCLMPSVSKALLSLAVSIRDIDSDNRSNRWINGGENRSIS